MSEHILLVTGSRVVAGSPFEAEAKAIVSALVFALPDSAFVVAGDASGPDAWAIEAATSSLLSLKVRKYSCDGAVLDGAGSVVRRWSEGPQHPLARNEAMVREVAARARRGATVRVLALEALWSRTKGTAHTVSCARSNGLAITAVSFSPPTTVDENEKV